MIGSLGSSLHYRMHAGSWRFFQTLARVTHPVAYGPGRHPDDVGLRLVRRAQ